MMRGLTATELLQIWERGVAQTPVLRALALLEAACPEMTKDQVLKLSIGQRDGRLIALREALFGPDLEALAACPNCGQEVEVTVNTLDLRGDLNFGSEATIQCGDVVLRLRPPNSEDLLLVSSERDLEQSCEHLVRRCLQPADQPDAEPGPLSTEVVEAAAQKIEEIDQLAEMRMAISCPSCAHSWQEMFDILSFLWTEVERWAGRMLCEVHALASAYAWREEDILALSPARRRVYLDMVGA